MSRWHQPWCDRPDIDVAGPTPKCKACGASAPTYEALAHQLGVQNSLSIPQDEVSGKMSFWWPPCLPWTHNLHPSVGVTPDEAKDAGHDKVPLKGTSEAQSPEDIKICTKISSPVYERSLRSDELRLICLAGSQDRDSPLHFSLELYDDVDCPEYETVSYTWAGEDGNAQRFQLVFIGPHWDAVPQTENCCSMIRYLRPLRGFRLVWIDCISINQEDLVEKSSQVSKMRTIYQRCTRTIIWLGEDLVHQSSKRYRSQHELPDLDGWTQDDQILAKIRSRRYFSRIWIIQELLFAPRSILPIYDVDFVADRSTLYLCDLPRRQGWSGLFSDRPWLEKMHSASPFIGKDLYLTLQQTWDSQSSDPRDKIFAILKLDKANQQSPLLVPNYTLSELGALLGVFGYLLLRLHYLHILEYAAGDATRPSWPSWMPDRRADWCAEWSSRLSVEGGRELYTQRNSNVGAWREMISIYHRGDPENSKGKDVPLGDYVPHSINHGIWCAEPEFRWYEDARINGSNTAISIRAIHLVRLKSPPALLYEGKHTHGFKIAGSSCQLFICSVPIALDKIIHTADHLFLVEQYKDWAEGVRGYLLFLRETDEENTFKLVKCCICYDIILCSNMLPRDVFLLKQMTDDQEPMDRWNLHPWKSLKDAVQDLQKIYHYYDSQDRQITLRNYHPSNKYGPLKTLYTHRYVMLFPGGKCPLYDFVTLLQRFSEQEVDGKSDTATNSHCSTVVGPELSERDTLHHSVQETYIKLLKQNFSACNPSTDGIYVFLLLEASEFRSQWLPWIEMLDHKWEFKRKEGDEWQKIGYFRVKYTTGTHVKVLRTEEMEGDDPFYLRYSFDELSRCIRLSPIYRSFIRLGNYTSATGESAFTMATRDARPEDDAIYPRIWPEVAEEELDLDGIPRRVWII